MSVTFSDIAAMLAQAPSFPTPDAEDCGSACASSCDMSTAHRCSPAYEKKLQFVSTLSSAKMDSGWCQVIGLLASMQGNDWPTYSHPRVALYASNYGTYQDLLKARLQVLASQQDPMTRLCAMVNADLRVYELDVDHAVPADGLSETEACHALSYGLMAVEEHVDCLVVAVMDPTALDVLQRWKTALESATDQSPVAVLTALQQAGAGADLFALVGAVCAARMARLPVFIAAEYADILPMAMMKLTPADDFSHCVVLPSSLAAEQAVQVLSSLHQLQFLLALAPAAPKKMMSGRTVLPNAA